MYVLVRVCKQARARMCWLPLAEKKQSLQLKGGGIPKAACVGGEFWLRMKNSVLKTIYVEFIYLFIFLEEFNACCLPGGDYLHIKK